MAMYVGVHPGGRSHFAVAALFFSGKAPAMLVHSRSYSAVNEVLVDIMGVCGEWGELSGLAIDAPLTWSGSASGTREADRRLREIAPGWAPKYWFRSPNTMPGSVAVQGPALTWTLTQEMTQGHIPERGVVETHTRLSLARCLPDMQDELLGYRNAQNTLEQRNAFAEKILQRFVDVGLIRIEIDADVNANALDAVVASLVSLAHAHPEVGMVLQHCAPGEIRPVGPREIAWLLALP